MSLAAAPRRARPSLLSINLAGAATCALMTAGWYLISLAPQQEARAQRQDLWEQLQPRLDKIGTLENQVLADRLLLSAVGEQIARGELQLRSIEQINQRIADITAAAGGHGLRLDEVKPGTPGTTHWFMTVPVRLSGSGDYPRLAAFLHALPTLFPDVAVTGFQIRGEPEAVDKPPRFELNLVWYAAPRGSGPSR
jgi:Tfp pilus assembly protein PilO